MTITSAPPFALGQPGTQPPPARSQQSYRHEAFLWRDIPEFTDAMVAFVQQGLAAGEPVMVALVPEHADWLRDGLGSDSTSVTFVDMRTVGRNPARLIPTWQRFLDDNSGHDRPARGVGEPIWAGRRPDEVAECQLHEALLNVAFPAESPFWLVCPYDAKRLDAGTIAEAHRSHHAILDCRSYRGSVSYAGRAHVDALFRAELPLPRGSETLCNFTRDSVDEVFAFVLYEACTANLWSDKTLDLAVAARELAADSLRRAADRGAVTIWQTARSLVCEVADDTVVDDVLAGRRHTPSTYDHGLWSANRVCDLVQMRSTAWGTKVRVHSWT